MSTLKTNNIQVGQSATSSQNFVLKTNNDGILKIARGNIGAELGDVLTVNADGTMVMPGVVGIVSQVDGVPTGALIERGSNANGSYERYAGGLQICWSVQAAIDITTTFGNIFRSGTYTVTHPATFSSVPTSSIEIDSAIMWGGTLSGSTSTVTVAAMYAFSVTGRAAKIVSFGRWF